MHKLPEHIRLISRAISACCRILGQKILFCGDVALYMATGDIDVLKLFTIEAIVIADDIEAERLYKCLRQRITINKEIENSKQLYHFITEGVEIILRSSSDFDPTDINQTATISPFNIGRIFYDLDNDKLVHPDGMSLSPIKNLLDRWEFNDIVDLLRYIGTLRDAQVDPEQLNKLSDLSLSSFKEPIDATWEDKIESILLLPKPGTALKFLVTTFIDGAPWVFQRLIDYIIYLNVSLNEDSTIDTVFTNKKFDLIDVYNDFYLSSQKTKETSVDLQKRLTTTLKLLFDSPSLSIPKAHISRAQVMQVGVMGRCCLGVGAGGNIFEVACGSPIEKDECQGLEIFCGAGSTECLSEHPAFTGTDFNLIPLPTHRAWCADQVCPPTGNVDCVDTGQGEIPDCFGSSPCDCDTGPAPTPDYCPDGNCFVCKAEDCPGPKCCCCSSIDIIFSVRAECYDKIFYSCDEAGNSAGGCFDNCNPPISAEPFDANCDVCFEACDFALGEGGHNCLDISGHGGESPPDWWRFPPGAGPCECNLTNRQNAPPITCVTCHGLKCTGQVNVFASNCNYQLSIEPNTTCCGTPALVDVVFAIDNSGSMGLVQDNVKLEVSLLAERLTLTGAQARFALIKYGQKAGGEPPDTKAGAPQVACEFTTDFALFQACLGTLVLDGAREPDFDAVELALQHYPWAGIDKLLFLIGDEFVESGGPITTLNDLNGQPTVEELATLANSLGVRIISIQTQSTINSDVRFDPLKKQLALATGGIDADIASSFSSILDDINLTVFGASCDCLDFTPIPLFFCSGGISIPPNPDDPPQCLGETLNVPITVCLDENNCNCNEDFAFNVCGEVVLIEPLDESTNLECCGEINGGLGGGCNCPSTECPPLGCCSLCDEVDVCSFESLEAAQQSLYCECFNLALQPDNDQGLTFVDQGICGIDCVAAPDNCEIRVPDGFCGFSFVSKEKVFDDILVEWRFCGGGDVDIPPPLAEKTCSPDCDRADQTIDQGNCIPVRNPATVVLNSGIGLVAFESLEENNSVIRLQQFNTSVPAKAMPNRPSNKGRLTHFAQWEGDPRIAKMYYYEDLPTHFMNGIEGEIPPDSEDLVTDIIVFRNGPFQNQCFPLHQTEEVGPIGSDAAGRFILFTVGDFALSNAFPSNDDVYNIEWYLIDRDDAGLTGSTFEAVPDTIPGGEFLANVSDVNNTLSLGPHTHNNLPAPVANPSLATAFNYSNNLENSHYVYLVYQALEDSKWNLYLRQIRLSEYSKEVQTQIPNPVFVALDSLNVTELTYRVVCVNDKCEEFGDDFLSSRTITMEVLLSDGRDVFNKGPTDLGLTEEWVGLCPGSDAQFLKKRVYATFSHSIVADGCPDQFGFNEIFYDWHVGDEFAIPFVSISASSLFLLLKKPNDAAVDLGSFGTPITAGGVSISHSQAGAAWFDDLEISTWVTIDSVTLDNLLRFKGLDVSEPIPITSFEKGHCTHPVVKTNANNDVFVTYECTDTTVQQIHITGTAVPVSILPNGIFTPKNLDANLDYFLSLDNFVYKQDITFPGDGINQLPDMFIDKNDQIHIAWQSNRNNYWEIYYGTSENSFVNKRITESNSKSLKPSITGDSIGNLHIAWHDNRFGNWEILMAYQDGELIEPLSEQDPYMASARNKNLGYEHFIDTAPLTLTNNTGQLMCISSLIVSFFEDRLLSNLAFQIIQADWPFAFEVPSIQTDRTNFSFVYPAFLDWEKEAAFGFDFPLPFTTIYKSPEFDASIVSEIESIIVTLDVTNTTELFMRFRASDIPDDPDADNQWTSWFDLFDIFPKNTPGFVTEEFSYDELRIYSLVALQSTNQPLERTFGRYKQVQINVDNGNYLEDEFLGHLNIKSIAGRLCLLPGDSVIASIDLTPEIRIDKEGIQVSEIPLPVKINKNQTYFLSVDAFSDVGVVRFPAQLTSISCESCTRSVVSWNSTSCSVFMDLTNNTAESLLFNAQFRVYTDQSLENLVAQFDAFFDGELKCFTVDGDTPAQTVWIERGFEILAGISKRLTLWPMLSNTAGLLCGIEYWIETSFCTAPLGDPGCTRLDLGTPQKDDWKCRCESARWDDRFENAPTNIRDSVRWVSSGDGFSDTRLTETTIGSSVNNFNPKIRIRNDLTGIVLYESNRADFNKDSSPLPEPSTCPSDPELYRMYASVFSVFPKDSMYASGAESIRSFNELLIKSDIPMIGCNGLDCLDDVLKIDNNGVLIDNPQFPAQCAMEGRNIDFSLDQYNNIFMAYEVFTDQTKCEEFEQGRERTIDVHRCGANAKNMAFTLAEGSAEAGSALCTSEQILGKTAPVSEDKIFKKIIQMVRVQNDFVVYHITRNKKPAAVVQQCAIGLDVIVTPDVVAVRARNEDELQWSNWYPFDPEIGDYTIRIPWQLSAGSGIKTITVQAATYQGLTVTYNTTVIADYLGIDHTIRLFKSTLTVPPQASDDSAPTVSGLASLFEVDANDFFDITKVVGDELVTTELPTLKGVPVVGIRPPALNQNQEIVTESGEYIFIQINPSDEYLNQFTATEIQQPNNAPTFDFIQQGTNDLFALTTEFHQDAVTGVISFRGVTPVKTEDETLNRDGLAFVIPHFAKDCGDLSFNLTTAEQHTPDKFNVMASEAQLLGGGIPMDAFSSERSEIGEIQHRITIRPAEDPYFVFGDPNYRLHRKDNE